MNTGITSVALDKVMVDCADLRPSMPNSLPISFFTHGINPSAPFHVPPTQTKVSQTTITSSFVPASAQASAIEGKGDGVMKNPSAKATAEEGEDEGSGASRLIWGTISSGGGAPFPFFIFPTINQSYSSKGGADKKL
jgi:hypothetical protein